MSFDLNLQFTRQKPATNGFQMISVKPFLFMLRIGSSLNFLKRDPHAINILLMNDKCFPFNT